MIYFIADLHGKFDFEGLTEYVKKATDDDLLIILGDLSLAFENTEENKKFTEDFLKINKNIAIVDGNHENYAFLNSFPEEEQFGGKVRRLTEHIVYLQRGFVYHIDEKNFFVFGGCKSSPKWKEQGLWHEGEEPTEEQLERAYASLDKCNCKVDYVLTHKYEQIPPKGTLCEKLQALCLFIDKNVDFKHWYVGHWHKNQDIDEKHTIVFDELCKLDY